MIPPRPRDAVELGTRDLRVVSMPTAAALDAARVVVSVTTHGALHDLTRCLASVAEQRISHELVVVILIDQVGADNPAVRTPPDLAGRIVVLTANCGSPARARNAVLEYVELCMPSCRWVARMDWDDRFADPHSLAAVVEVGERHDASYVVGGNRVLSATGEVLRLNPATQDLFDAGVVVDRLREMADGTAENELPSCNLLLSSRAGLRYPDTASAEDHWLVASLLILEPGRGAVLEAPLFADYTLDGAVTRAARGEGRHHRARVALHAASVAWRRAWSAPGRVLGFGQEGIVRLHDGVVVKHFYADVLGAEKAGWLERLSDGAAGIVPAAQFRPDVDPGTWIATYPWEETTPATAMGAEAVRAFLSECLARRLVCGNIKRSNFRVRCSGELVYIDLGNWIVPMDVSVLRDSAARLYSVGVLGWSDEEVLRRSGDHTRPEIWDRLPGFASFYGGVVSSHLTRQWPTAPPRLATPRHPDVSLMIKACAMDAAHARVQIDHVLDQLVGPWDFAERVLLIDPHRGPFPRPHAEGDFDALLAVAAEAVSRGVLDRFVVAPADALRVERVNREWFGIECARSHSVDDVPVAPQLWGFEQIRTRYVLQCDIDVLVGRRDRSHDYLREMIAAARVPDVVGVAFNIAKEPGAGFDPYGAPAGEHKPEVRCGLLDLERLAACRPLPNAVADGRLTMPWYRALHARQRELGLRTVRGGDPATFYVHPPNQRKRDDVALARIRDLVAQGRVPSAQWGRWDLESADSEWAYPRRSESLVVLARGRNTGLPKIERFAASLAMQDDQTFGVVVIDDASDDSSPSELAAALGWIGDRLTLVRHAVPRGRMANDVFALREICSEPTTLVVVVDLDDALADRSAMRRLRALREVGHDVVLAAPFRPDASTKIYRPCFERPRETYGGDVWIHLRAFAKGLFDRLPDEALQLDGRWLAQCADYAIMVPVVEMARNPVYVPEYLYWHERHTRLTSEERAAADGVILRILAKAPIGSRG